MLLQGLLPPFFCQVPLSRCHLYGKVSVQHLTNMTVQNSRTQLPKQLQLKRGKKNLQTFLNSLSVSPAKLRLAYLDWDIFHFFIFSQLLEKNANLTMTKSLALCNSDFNKQLKLLTKNGRAVI